jgi:hypothetical protein
MLNKMKQKFGLESEEKSVRVDVMRKITEVWTPLEESSAIMERYLSFPKQLLNTSVRLLLMYKDIVKGFC